MIQTLGQCGWFCTMNLVADCEPLSIVEECSAYAHFHFHSRLRGGCEKI